MFVIDFVSCSSKEAEHNLWIEIPWKFLVLCSYISSISTCKEAISYKTFFILQFS